MPTEKLLGFEIVFKIHLYAKVEIEIKNHLTVISIKVRVNAIDPIDTINFYGNS